MTQESKPNVEYDKDAAYTTKYQEDFLNQIKQTVLEDVHRTGPPNSDISTRSIMTGIKVEYDNLVNIDNFDNQEISWQLVTLAANCYHLFNKLHHNAANVLSNIGHPGMED